MHIIIPSILHQHVSRRVRIRMSSLTKALASDPEQKSGSVTISINPMPVQTELSVRGDMDKKQSYETIKILSLLHSQYALHVFIPA